MQKFNSVFIASTVKFWQTRGFSHRNTSTNNLCKAATSSCDPVLRDKPLEFEKSSLFIMKTLPGSRQYKNSSLSCTIVATLFTSRDVPENTERKMNKKSVITDKLPFLLTKTFDERLDHYLPRIRCCKLKELQMHLWNRWFHKTLLSGRWLTPEKGKRVN